MINSETTLHEIAEQYPEALAVLAEAGFPALREKHNLQRIGRSITLAMAAGMRGLDVEELATRLNEARAKAGDRSVRKEAEDLWIAGMLPCPVRLPMSESINEAAEALSRRQGRRLHSEFQAAYAGADWIGRHVHEGMGLEEFPDLLLAAGYRLFFTDPTIRDFRDAGAFADYSGLETVNRSATAAELRDPAGAYTVLGSVPAIILANPEVLGDRPVPRSWEEILSPTYAGSLSVPMGDFDLFDGLILTIHAIYGREGIDALGRNLFRSMHPSEAVASEGSASQPALAVVPYFFAATLRKESNYVPVWPREGAFAAPLFMLARGDRPEIGELARFVAGREVAQILWGMGRFPTVHPEVEPELPGPLLWPGWEFLLNRELEPILRDAEERLFGAEVTV